MIPKKVQLVDGNGNLIKIVSLEENRLGSECSGSDGANERVLTLQNTSETGNPLVVWVESTMIDPSDYTVSHLSNNSTITFDNIGIFDADRIRVMYHV